LPYSQQPRVNEKDFEGSKAWLQYGAEESLLEWFKKQWVGMPLPKLGEEVEDGSASEWRREMLENLFYAVASAC
jgi:hypothetical protein